MKCSELNDVRCQGIPYEVYEEIKEHKFGGKSARTIKVLKIRSALYSRDQGEFECIATNGHAQPAKLIIDLNVLGMYKLKAVFNFCIRTQILLPDTQVFDSMIWKVGKNHVHTFISSLRIFFGLTLYHSPHRRILLSFTLIPASG